MLTFTAKQLTKLAPYPRLAYINKQKGMVYPDIETEPDAKNKEYSVPMAFKWGFFTAFDGKYSIEVANSIAAAAMATTPWILAAKDSGSRLWFVDIGGEVMTSGFSFSDASRVQSEEEQEMCKFTLFDMYSWPGSETTIFVKAKGNPYLTQGSSMSGSAAGFYTPPRQKPVFTARMTSLYSSIGFYCISDIFERVAAKYEIDPYEESLKTEFSGFQELPLGFDVESLRFTLK